MKGGNEAPKTVQKDEIIRVTANSTIEYFPQEFCIQSSSRERSHVQLQAAEEVLKSPASLKSKTTLPCSLITCQRKIPIDVCHIVLL